MAILPAIPKLIQRTKALAALDLILSPEWESRYYSFNAKWDTDEQMASMRNGSGDEWWIVFHNRGWAALKGLAHESAWSKNGNSREMSASLQSIIPRELSGFANEPAFRWNETNFAYFCLADSMWTRANDLIDSSRKINSDEDYLLRHLAGSAEDYASFARDYYETSVPVEIVSAVFATQPITSGLIAGLNPEITIEDISSELFGEINYPRS